MASMKRPSTTSSNPSSGSGMNNYVNLGSFNSYQHQIPKSKTTMTSSSTTASGGVVGAYKPPVYYAADQTKVLEDSTKVYYQTEDTANAVLNQLTQQRQQVVGAHNNVWEMRSAADKVQQELEELKAKYQAKKRRLYMYIGALSLIDFLLFFRIIQCGGNFYCF